MGTTAKDKLAAVNAPNGPLDVNFDHVDLTLWTYDLQGKDVYRWNFENQMTDMRVELNITQASTVEIDLQDSDFQVLNDPLFQHWAWDIQDVSFSSQKKFKTSRIQNTTNTAYLGDSADLEWVLGQKPIDFKLNEQIYFRLCGLQSQQTTLTITVEDRIASLLRQQEGPLSWDRSQHTRAQFVAMLCRQAGVDYFIPEINVQQAIIVDNPPSTLTPQAKPSNVNFTAAGQRQFTSGQITFISDLTALTGLNAGVVASWVYAEENGSAAQARQASSNNNWLNIGYFDSGPGVIAFNSAFGDPTTAAQQTARFLNGTWGGASAGIRAILSHTGQAPADQIAAIQGSGWASSGYPTLPQIYTSVGQPAVTGTPGTTSVTPTLPATTGSYAFTRGANETSWDCIQRLASEVAWYAFARQNKLWFVSGNYLWVNQDPQLVCEVRKNGIDYIDVDMDTGARDQIAQCLIYGRTALWTALPGMLITIKNRGPASGNWIVTSVESHPRDATQQAIITVQKPVPKRAEPAATTSTSTSSTSSITALQGIPGNAGITAPAPNSSPGRLDMGQDGNYDMTKGAVAPYNGTIFAIGITGWPGQGQYFAIKNDDQSGPDYTRAMYFAEGATPIYPNGTHVTMGQKIGNPVQSGGNGAPGNFEIGPANTTTGDCLAKSYGLGSAGAKNMVLAFSRWIQTGGMPAPSSTGNAGAP